jgi:XTP/dITP diphosphohydrolase
VNILVATGNPGKLKELDDLLSGMPHEVVSLAAFPDIPEVPETGDTFAENARLKAVEYARLTGLAALADDSGLAVDALGGRPGVLSARYGGADLAFPEKIRKLLDEIALLGAEERGARFVCAMAFADAGGNILFETEGVCEGRIAHAPRGSKGFGFDPIFIPEGYEETFGELDLEIKQKISHRARAFNEIIPFLRHFSEN